MLEVTIWSLLVGNLGWQAVVVSGWLRWQQSVTSRQHQEEEETLTSFESKDLTEIKPPQRNGKVHLSSRPQNTSTDPNLVGWEFKIVRANRDLFRDPAILQKLCQEEAAAGWILLEKLDDRRVRFKRLIAIRDMFDPKQLTFDPYRCHYGSSFTPLTLVGAIAAVVAIAIPSYFGYTLVSRMLADSPKNPSPSPYEQIPPQDFPPAN